MALPDALARKGNVRLRSAYHLNMSDVDDVKRAIVDNGVVAMNYHHDGGALMLWADGTVAYYCNYLRTYSGYTLPTNHAVSVVGWDDNFDREYFQDDDGG